MKSAFSRRRRHLGGSQENEHNESRQPLVENDQDADSSFFQPQATSLFNQPKTMESEEAESISRTTENEEAEGLTSSTAEMEEESISTRSAEEEETISTRSAEEEQETLNTSTAEEEETISTKTAEQEEESISSETRSAEDEKETLNTRTAEEEESQTACKECGGEETASESGYTSTVTCGLNAKFDSIPSGRLKPSFVGGVFRAPFNMKASFTSTGAGCDCSDGEYRQYVKGYFKKNGRFVTHNLCGTALSKSKYQEDCGVFGGRTLKYGYRSIRFGNSYFDTPDQATGCKFHGFDSPGIGAASGDKVEVNLHFVGKLVNRSTGKVYKKKKWSVKGKGVRP